MAIATSIIAAAVIGAAATVYTAEKQEDIANEERRRLEREEEERKAEAERIAKETRPYGEELSAITFGAGEGGAAMGSTSDFLVTKTAGSLGTSGGSGLGFNV